MPDIMHRIKIVAPAAKVYSALTTQEGLSNWWTRDTVAKPEVDSVIEFGFADRAVVMKMKVLELEQDKKVVWRCLAGDEQWINTRISFDLVQEGEVTVLMFRHLDWREATDLCAHCNTKWACFLLSLKSYMELGKGMPHPNDLAI